MSSEQPRRSREAASGGSPMGSTAAIIIAIVAVVAGFLILREIRSDDTSSGAADTTTIPTTVPDTTPTTIPITTPTTVPLVTDGATAIVANASGVNGVAGTLTTALTGKNFTMAKPTNGSEKRDASIVYYDESNPAALAVATSIASLMGSEVTVQPMPKPAPVAGGTLPAEVTVLVMLGADKAAKTLPEMAGATTVPAVTTTVPQIATATTV